MVQDLAQVKSGNPISKESMRKDRRGGIQSSKHDTHRSCSQCFLPGNEANKLARLSLHPNVLLRHITHQSLFFPWLVFWQISTCKAQLLTVGSLIVPLLRTGQMNFRVEWVQARSPGGLLDMLQPNKNHWNHWLHHFWNLSCQDCCPQMPLLPSYSFHKKVQQEAGARGSFLASGEIQFSSLQ